MEKNIAARIGRNIAQARKAASRTQADVAEKLGIDTGSLSRMERGIIMPSIPTLDKIADELGVALWQLIGSASSSSIVMAENIITQLEKLGQRRAFVSDGRNRAVGRQAFVVCIFLASGYRRIVFDGSQTVCLRFLPMPAHRGVCISDC